MVKSLGSRNLLGMMIAFIAAPAVAMDAPNLAPAPSGGFVVMQDNRPGEAGRLTFKEAMRDGFMRGIISSCDRLVNNISTIALIPALKKVGQVSGGMCKRVVRLVHGVRGFEPEELFGISNVLSRGIATYVSGVAKGARVVRAHVLDQQTDQAQQIDGVKTPLVGQMPFGITMLKEDLSYAVEILTARLEHYNKKPSSGTLIAKTADAASVVGSGYGAISFARGTADNATRAVAALCALRMCLWARSERAMALVDDMQGLDRTTIAHLTKSLIACFKHMIQLCDSIKDDNDIARLKDEFEGLGKQCSEMLVQIAFAIDSDRALQLQRLGKPGQASMSLSQSLGGGLGGMPHLGM